LPQTEQIAEYFQIDPLGMLASGSLLATVDPAKLPALEAMQMERCREFAIIGKITSAAAGFKLIEGEATRDLPLFAMDEVSRALMHDDFTKR
jgi:hydrogenase maturation factor